MPALAACFLLVKSDFGRWLALAIFTAACITDWLDGYLARVWDQQSTLGPHARPDRRQAAGRHRPAAAGLRQYHRQR